MSVVFDQSVCTLGEGPFWHPKRQQVFWFDIDGKQLKTSKNDHSRTWQFDKCVSAAGWIDDDRILMASETDLSVFRISKGVAQPLVALEDDKPETRSNDGRADPWGGFWIGTMGKNAEPELGAIYRYYLGEVQQLYAPITIPNAICFTPDRRFAFFTDTPTRQVMRQALKPETGWPDGDPEVWLDLRADALNPDGAVIDATGNMWLAQWGTGRVACYSPDAEFLKAVAFPARHTSCPAFGGENLSTLFCTSAAIGVPQAQREAEPSNGMTFAVSVDAQGQAEHQVIL